MKNYLHLVFTAALLLGSLILLNEQRSEKPARSTDNLAMAAEELLAELPGNLSAENLLTSGLLQQEASFESKTGDLKQLAFQNQLAQTVRCKAQLQMYLELKPVLFIRNGQTIYHHVRSVPPPIC